MKSMAGLAALVLTGFCLSGCQQPQNTANTNQTPQVTEKPFVAGGSIHMQLEAGGYEVRPAADNQIRVTFSGNIGDAKLELTTDGAHAELKVQDTPHNNFRAVLEVPKSADLVVRLGAGDLAIGAITGNKDVENNAGNITIAVGDAANYSSVDASVKAGDISAAPFGGSKSGLLQHFTWEGKGQYKLRANLIAGNLSLRSN
jgi:hypothetical protein